MKKISLLTLTLFALSWATTTTPMFRAFAGRFGNVAKLAAATFVTGATVAAMQQAYQAQEAKFAENTEYERQRAEKIQKLKKLRSTLEQDRDKALKSDSEDKQEKIQKVIQAGHGLIKQELSIKFYSNQHDQQKFRSKLLDLIKQKQEESDDSSLLRTEYQMQIMDNPEYPLHAACLGFHRYGQWQAGVNSAKFLTIDHAVGAMAHELVHIDKEHNHKKFVVSHLKDKSDGVVPFDKCLEIEADSRAMFDRDKKNGLVTINEKLLDGLRGSLQLTHQEEQEEYAKFRNFIQPIIDEDFVLPEQAAQLIAPYSENSFEKYCEKRIYSYPDLLERQDNLKKLEKLAQQHGGTMPEKFLDKHIAENVHCQEAADFLKIAQDFTCREAADFLWTAKECTE